MTEKKDEVNILYSAKNLPSKFRVVGVLGDKEIYSAEYDNPEFDEGKGENPIPQDCLVNWPAIGVVVAVATLGYMIYRDIKNSKEKVQKRSHYRETILYKNDKGEIFYKVKEGYDPEPFVANIMSERHEVTEVYVESINKLPISTQGDACNLIDSSISLTGVNTDRIIIDSIC